MCGIAGKISVSGTSGRIERDMLISAGSFLKYRGPDDYGVEIFESQNVQVGFYHSRLSIVDLSPTGHQPMTSPSGRTTIVFNGEIYNYKELKKQLIESGLTFKTNSDTEVILVAVEFWGIEKTLDQLDGMFVFAIFDRKYQTLSLARDRFGKKPLYYNTTSQELSFSSDIRSFRYFKKESLKINIEAAGYYFSELSTPGNTSIWEDIEKLPPAHYLVFDQKGNFVKKPYWKSSYSFNCKMSEKDIIKHTGELLSAAVKKRLIADVPVSALLSGGLDSSLIVAKMAENMGKRVKTYSVGFAEGDFNELPYANQVVKKFDTDHTEFILAPTSLIELDQLMEEYGEPFADSSMVPSYLISKEVSKNEKVVLGGDGGDELFAGYNSYYFAYKYDKVKRFGNLNVSASWLSNLLPGYRTEFLAQLLNQTKKHPSTMLDRGFGFDTADLRELNSTDRFYNALINEHKKVWLENRVSDKYDLLNVLSASLKTRLLNDYLVKVDRASMFASLEMRSPFLDRSLFEFVSTLTPNQLYKPHGPKSILKALAINYFDEDFIHRKKMGFGVPFAQWFRGDFKERLNEVVMSPNSLLPLNLDFVSKVLNEHNSGKVDHVHKLWALYVFNIWSSKQ